MLPVALLPQPQPGGSRTSNPSSPGVYKFEQIRRKALLVRRWISWDVTFHMTRPNSRRFPALLSSCNLFRQTNVLGAFLALPFELIFPRLLGIGGSLLLGQDVGPVWQDAVCDALHLLAAASTSKRSASHRRHRRGHVKKFIFGAEATADVLSLLRHSLSGTHHASWAWT